MSDDTRKSPDPNAGQAAWLDYHFPAATEPVISITKLRAWIAASGELDDEDQFDPVEKGYRGALADLSSLLDELEKAESTREQEADEAYDRMIRPNGWPDEKGAER